MPPIPVHIDDPITPTKPQGVTPQTAAHAPVVPSPASNVATTTGVSQPAPYPAARPGAAAVPAPTPYLPSPQPTATRTTSENGPPPPQQGAVPVPFSKQAPMTAGSGLPPPPKAGESVQQGSAFTGALNHMYTPPPAQQLQHNYAPTHSTSTAGITPNQATTPQHSGPTTLNFGPVVSPFVGQDAATRRISSEHPPGYVQNVYAQELSPAQRASLEQETRRESFVDKLASGLGGAGGERDEMGGERRVSEGVGSAWDAAKGWLGKAGTAIAEGEQEVWRRINGH